MTIKKIQPNEAAYMYHQILASVAKAIDSQLPNRVHPSYKDEIWTPRVGEIPVGSQEAGNVHGRGAMCGC